MSTPRLMRAIAPIALAAGLIAGGCARSDTRVNSDPGPGRPSRADSGDAANKVAPDAATPSASSATAGTDSTGRPADSSGGTTHPGSGSKTSGTQTQSQPDQPKTGSK